MSPVSDSTDGAVLAITWLRLHHAKPSNGEYGAVSAVGNGRHERLNGGRDSAATVDKHLVRECPFLTMVPVMAISDLVASR